MFFVYLLVVGNIIFLFYSFLLFLSDSTNYHTNYNQWVNNNAVIVSNIDDKEDLSEGTQGPFNIIRKRDTKNPYIRMMQDDV